MVDVFACRLFDMAVRTHIAPHCVRPACGPVQLEVVPGDVATEGTGPLGPPALSVHMEHPDGGGQYEAWVRGPALLLKIAPVAWFACTPGRIEFQCLKPVAEETLQWQLFGLVLSAWSEWTGRPVLHGATVRVGEAAVGFLGRSGAGKSSITMEFLSHGHRIFGDDQLVLDMADGVVCARTAVPWLKVDADLAHRAGRDHAQLPRIHSVADKRRLDVRPDELASEPSPVGPLYLVERGWHRPEVVIEPLGAADSLLALVQHSYVPRTAAAAGLTARRLPLLSAAAQQGGVWRLRYPDGVEWLADVRAAVVRHVASRPSGSPAPSRQ